MPTLRLPSDVLAPGKFASSLFKPKHKPTFLEDPIRLLKVAADSKDLKVGKTIHAHLVIKNQISSKTGINQTNSLINLYVKCDQLSLARKLFDLMHERNVVSWGALMAGYLHNGLALEVLGLFKSMILIDNMCPNEYILTTVISSCSNCGRVEEGRQCHGHVLKRGMVFYQYVKNALIHMYSKCSEVEGAMRVLDMVPGNNIISYNSVLNGLLEHGKLKEAIEVLSMMVDEHLVWDTVTYITIFGLIAQLKNLRLGLQVHSRVLKTEIEWNNAFLNSAIIDMYGKCGKIINAMKFFSCLQTHNVVSWTTIIAAYLQNGCFEEALNLFRKMKLEGITPNEYSFAVSLNSSACLSSLRHGDLLHASAEKSGFKNHIIVGNALINMYAKSGNIAAANEVFSNIPYRNSVTWNTMISGYSHYGFGKEALNVFQDMLAAGECPNYVTYIGVLSACAHLGLVQQGFYYLNCLMKENGIEPGVEHHTCIVMLLSRAGLLDKAESYMRFTPVKWDVVAWRTLLNASHVHRNYGLGRRVADVIVEMYPNDEGTYILLSNMYAKEMRWDRVVKIRKLMRERNIKKEPGVSWVEIRNTTHVFVSEDYLHPESSRIREKVGELLAMIKPLGYVPDIAAVLHDVEDEQKEYYLRYHSEKLAIAYGIMKTPSEAPIRVIKNLRMCDDCHTAVKLISKATNRVLIIRDSNRFHHFKDGCCSCADYW
ncbi:hypothetical protein FNV43_RR02146 [Rhamnella rubrinervis]|uniref:DYW domain-containing protein n=1 Tax=Rhamnella rubrinervis TaxID=2594499 RepID=A0A8K0HSN9_9ROSA|nr:hypothetical protein FNV43_RR02146 [Rhamnella rubrinervis]